MKRAHTLALAAFALASVLFCTSRSGAVSVTPADQAREAAAQQAFAQYKIMHGSSLATADTVYQWSVRLYLAQKKTRSVASPEQEHLARVTALQAQVKTAVQAGLASRADESAAAYYVAEAQVWVNDGGIKP